ncbi:hypothetical protein FUAX_04790 [Fulvitalea axinellae]|uniref:Uncharacterized protein n=1 Tax=Fulvitalea axinellae TaxID=1182444 RepID=A0AAU9CRQ2_9BACT|nr:hypothetical protein FUAX_04790 [Fulvitalea axinellae]
MRLSHILLYSLALVSLLSCGSRHDGQVNFYHWKAKAEMSPAKADALRQAGGNTLYLRYFDVDQSDPKAWDAYPEYVLRKVDKAYKGMNVVPVVYITNRTLKNCDDTEYLAKKIGRLTNQISQRHFGKAPQRLQIDCDWTQSTREAYFKLLKELKRHYSLEATIRLHQIKYKDRTGIPPVDRGTLMLYNMGDLSDMNKNSIIGTDIVKDYINTNTDYPISLDLALPLFAQTVVKSPKGRIKLIRGTDGDNLSKAEATFERLGDNLFRIKRDTLYKGFYLTENYRLKMEQSPADVVAEAYRTVRTSQIQIKDIILYHLDEETLASTDLKKLLKQL